MKLKIKKRFLIPVVAAAGYFLGPQPASDYPPIEAEIEPLEISLTELEAYVDQQEAKVANIRPDNEAEIIWADSVRQTEYAIVYLHGYSATKGEADPFHKELAQRYGCNLFLPRLAAHGLADEGEAFRDLTPNELVESAAEAIAVAQVLGKKIIVMATSTGAPLGIHLSAKNPGLIHAFLLYSPNINLESKLSHILTKPWGLHIAKMLSGERHSFEPRPGMADYWTYSYPQEGVLSLRTLLDQTMHDEVFAAIDQPVMIAYYYKNEEERDMVISTDAIRDFVAKVKTPAEQLWDRPLPDPGVHVITSRFHREDISDVKDVSFAFVEEVIGLEPLAVEVNE